MQTVMKRVRREDSRQLNGWREGEVRRMPEKQATALVKTGEYVYATRTEWKDAGRAM